MAPTSMTVMEMRARIVAEELLALPDRVFTRADIAGVPRLARWRTDVLEQAIRDLLTERVLVEMLDGRLALGRGG